MRSNTQFHFLPMNLSDPKSDRFLVDTFPCPHKIKRPGGKPPGPLKSWDGARHTLFPRLLSFGALLTQADSSPTLFLAATRSFGLIAGPSK